ncbi:MAG: RNA-binding S4 domain-containing protein [Verrucomicrobium sp.]
MRADLYLHHVRIFKTRSLATQACTRGQVQIGGQMMKPSRELKLGEVLDIQRGDLSMVVQVVAYPATRVGAPLVKQFMLDLTPAENYQQAAEARREKVMLTPHAVAAKPDKKQLRMIRELMERNQG